MKMSDILRDLSDKLAAIENGGGNDEPNQAALEPVEVDHTASDEDDSGQFMPPLQQKIELLKKGVGVASAFDQDGNGVPDELDAIKKNAGINPAVIHIASDDEPLDV
jgi:hypothetical protein